MHSQTVKAQAGCTCKKDSDCQAHLPALQAFTFRPLAFAVFFLKTSPSFTPLHVTVCVGVCERPKLYQTQNGKIWLAQRNYFVECQSSQSIFTNYVYCAARSY